jgi:hypothetical protein
MKKITLTLLASAALAMPAMIPAMAQNAPQTQQPQAQQQNGPQQNAQQPNQQQPNQQANQQNQGQNQQQASSRTISPRQLGRNGVREVQQALAKKGFHSGRADGIFGRDTRMALRSFQKSKGINSTGQLNKKTLSDLGVNVASNENNGNQNGNQNPGQNGSSAQPTQNQQ